MRDSAGIRIAELDGSVLETPSTSLPEPALELGEVDGTGPEVFGRVASALRLSDGAVAVLDGTAAEVRVFEPDGSLRSRFGREGGGPGEFTFPNLLLRLPGDTVVVVDRGGARTHRFLSDGTLIGHEDMVPSAPQRWLIDNVFADGSWMVVSREIMRNPPAVGRQEAWVVGGRKASGAAEPDSMARYLNSVMFIESAGEMVSFMYIPLTPAGAIAPLGGSLVAHDGRDYELRWNDEGGSIRQLLRIDATPPPLTGADFDADRDRGLANIPEQNRAGVARIYRDMPRESTLPAFGPMLGDREGLLLVSVTPRPAAPADGEIMISWLVVRDDGSVAGRIELSSRERPRYLDATHLVTTRPGELDVEQVRVYPLPVELTSAP